MSNDELMSKFRRMLDRKKKDEPYNSNANNTYESNNSVNLNTSQLGTPNNLNSSQTVQEEKQELESVEGNSVENLRPSPPTRGRPTVFNMAKRFEQRDNVEDKAENYPKNKEEENKFELKFREQKFLIYKVIFLLTCCHQRLQSMSDVASEVVSDLQSARLKLVRHYWIIHK